MKSHCNAKATRTNEIVMLNECSHFRLWFQKEVVFDSEDLYSLEDKCANQPRFVDIEAN